MNVVGRLEMWRQQGVLSAEQKERLAGLSRGEPFSLSLEIHVLLYVGVLAFVGGLGWTVSTWSHQVGDVLVMAVLTAIFAASLGYCFTRGPAWTYAETQASSVYFDYVLYLGCLVWGVELAYMESRLQVLSGQWDLYLLATAVLFFLLAYRFDNRFVLSLAMSSLAGWFGLRISHWPSHQDAQYREYALVYCLLIVSCGGMLRYLKVKGHFFGTYLNVAANVLFCALLSGVFEEVGYGKWVVGLLVACAAALFWGVKRRQFAFVAYAAVYGYVGVSALVVRSASDVSFLLFYFVFTAIVMLVGLIQIARHFGRRA